MRERPITRNEREFVIDGLRSTDGPDGGCIRQDGRGRYDYRNTKIKFEKDNGNVMVEMGNTKVMVQVTAEVTEPQLGYPAEGMIRFHVDLTPLAAPSFDSSRPTPEGAEVERIIEQSLRDSKALDRNSLCIVPEERVWSVEVNIFILDNDGNMIDAASLATVAALLRFRRPFVRIQDGEAEIFAIGDHEPVPLAVHHRPFCVSFGILSGESEDDTIIVVDPTAQEQILMDGQVVIVMNPHNEICGVHKIGKVMLTNDDMMLCIKIAEQKVKETALKLESEMKAEDARKAQAAVVPMETSNTILESAAVPEPIEPIGTKEADPPRQEKKSKKKKAEVSVAGADTAILFEGRTNTWLEESDDELEAETQKKSKKKRKAKN